MKTKLACGAFVLPLVLVFGLSGCESDNATPTTSQPAASMGPPPAGVTTVKVLIDTGTPGSTVEANGMRLGYTPVELHIEANPSGALLYAVDISVTAGSGAIGGAGSGSAKYAAGEKIPAKIQFNRGFKTESDNYAPFDTKPTT